MLPLVATCISLRKEKLNDWASSAHTATSKLIAVSGPAAAADGWIFTFQFARNWSDSMDSPVTFFHHISKPQLETPTHIHLKVTGSVCACGVYIGLFMRTAQGALYSDCFTRPYDYDGIEKSFSLGQTTVELRSLKWWKDLNLFRRVWPSSSRSLEESTKQEWLTSFFRSHDEHYDKVPEYALRTPFLVPNGRQNTLNDFSQAQFGYWVSVVNGEKNHTGLLTISSVELSYSMQANLYLEPLLKERPLLQRFIPNFTTFQLQPGAPEELRAAGDEFVFCGYTINFEMMIKPKVIPTHSSPTIMCSSSCGMSLPANMPKFYLLPGYNPQFVRLVPGTYPESTYFSSLTDDTRRALVGNDGKWYTEDTPIVKDIYSMIREQLQTHTIRGHNLYDLLKKLFIQQGLAYPVVITGGAIRDAILQHQPKDIDLVIGCKYEQLVLLLKDTFGLKGESLSDSTLRCSGKSKNFGQLKVIQFSEETIEDLDTAMFKAMRVPDPKLVIKLSNTTLDKDNQYLYGWSYYADALQRDYSMNALYLELFGNPPYLIDPLPLVVGLLMPVMGYFILQIHRRLKFMTWEANFDTERC